MEKEKNLILKVTEYAFSKNHFTLNQLIEDLGLSGSEKQFSDTPYYQQIKILQTLII